MHIPPHDNRNRAIVDMDDPIVPLVYFNIVVLQAGATFDYRTAGNIAKVVDGARVGTVVTA